MLANFSLSRAMQHLVRVPSLPSSRAKKRPLYQLTERELIQRESEVGRTLFGSIKKGHRREFFNTDEHIWIWHEEWTDAVGKKQQLTTKYEVRDDGTWKVQPGPRYVKLTGEELQNFSQAVTAYFERVMRDIYHRDPKTGQKLL